ncbi:MAG TPA: DegT/DnrJ/EryC1/StrS family aminotransferase [Verrucomicrobiae bacterium]|nr:DegT/DnrJ/EryC1/StrS family aminotransferase [Verrucomicrobiae bacterium]
MSAPVPFLDLRQPTAALRGQIDGAIARVLDRGLYLLGPELEAFESEFASWCGARHCAGVASGFSALQLIVRACGIGPGDEVIVPGNTHIATWLAVTSAGARPVPVDPDAATRVITAAGAESAITPRTRAVFAVHLYGMPCDLKGLSELCRGRGLRLLVDAAQSAGAEIDGSRNLCHGDAAAYSFYPTKNLGALGDGGAVVTDDPEIDGAVRLLRNYGMRHFADHPMRGVNARMEEIHAAVLREKLVLLDEWNARRAALARRYMGRLEGMPGVAGPEVPGWAGHAWHLFVVEVEDRDLIRRRLDAEGIGTAVHYPLPPHRTAALETVGPFPPLPITDRLSRRVLSLPMNPFLSDAQADRVMDALAGALGKVGG